MPRGSAAEAPQSFSHVMWERASRSHHNPAFSAVAKHGGRLPRRRNRMEDSVKLSETQLRLMPARDDRALERPSNLVGGGAGSLPVWRRDGDIAHTLRFTKRGLQAIRDEATAADTRGSDGNRTSVRIW
jgi:hypothetical protein